MRVRPFHFFFIFIASAVFVLPTLAQTEEDYRTPLCEQQRKDQVIQCIKSSEGQANSQENIAKCSVEATKAFIECKGGKNFDKGKESEFQTPDPTVLNQFKGLTVQRLLGNIIRAATGVMGTIAFAIMVYAGFLWMTAAGNSEKSGKAMNMMVWAALGIIVIMSSYTIVKFILDAYAN